MKRINDNISAETINEYLRIRAEQYKEKAVKGMTIIQENEFYSNIMEIMSVIDYAGITLTISNSALIKEIRESHYNPLKSSRF